MNRIGIVAIAAALVATPAAAETHPGRLAHEAADSPKANATECVAARADALDWSEGGVGKVLKGAGRILVWPLAERSAERRSEERNAARERVMERVRQACFVQPEFERAPPSPDQRWPMARGYDGKLSFVAKVGGRSILVMVHPTTNTLWMLSKDGGPGSALWTPDGWVRPVAWAIEPTGCRVTEDVPSSGNTREVGFVCPADVDLRALVRSQAASLRAGDQLRR